MNFNRNDVPTSSNQTSSAMGDFNNDGKTDLIVGTSGPDRLTVFLGNGSGAFTTLAGFASIGGTPQTISTADFNKDGKLDLVIGNTGKSFISVYLGNGAGGFGAATNYTVGAGNLFPTTINEFSQDGKLDIAIANQTTGQIVIMNGNGTGAFTVGSSFAVSGAQSSVTADFNRDGKTDLAVPSATTNTIRILLGNGSGSFTPGATLPGFNDPRLSTGDFDNDGIVDLAIANAGGSTAVIYTGTGSGAFTLTSTINTGANPIVIKRGEFNNDGNLDLVVLRNGQNFANVYMGDGTGNFGSLTSYAVGNNPNNLFTNNFNSDSRVDIVTLNQGSHNISVLQNSTPITTTSVSGSLNEAGATTSIFTFTLSDPAPAGGLVVNFNIANTTSLADYNLAAGTNVIGVTSSSFTIAAGATTATLNVNTVDDAIIDPEEVFQFNLLTSPDYIVGASGASFKPAGSSPIVQPNPGAIALADTNGDGKTDLLVTDQVAGQIAVRLGSGNGSFGTATNFSLGIGATGNHSVVAGRDFDNDGKGDLVTANANSNNISILRGNGTGGFFPAVNYTVGTNPWGVIVGQFNKLTDSDVDLVVVNRGSNMISVLAGDNIALGSGFSLLSNISVGGLEPVAIDAGDFNQDGKLDIAIANYASNNVSVMLGDGLGGFGTPSLLSVGTNPFNIRIGDFNKDGFLDLVTCNFGSNNVSVLLNDGSGTGNYLPAVNYAVSANPRAVRIGDLNRDGNQDLVVANQGSNTLAILLGTGTGSFNALAPIAAGTGLEALAVSDVSSDSLPDIITLNGGTNDISLLLNSTFTQILPIADNDISVSVSFGANGSESGPVNGQLNFSLSSPAPAGGLNLFFDLAGSTATLPNDYTFVAGANVTAVNGTQVSIAPGATTASINAVPVDDLVYEAGGETVQLTLVPNGNYLIGTATATINIADNDAIPSNSLSISDATITEGDSGSQTATFTITLAPSSGQTVTVEYSTQDGTAKASDNDYVSKSGILTFNPGVTTQTITVDVNGDLTDEANELFFVKLQDSINAVIADDTGNSDITDNDNPPIVTISPATLALAEGNGGTTAFTFNVTLSNPSAQLIRVNYSTQSGSAIAGTDYIDNDGLLNFNPGETNKTITVDIIGESLFEATESFDVTLNSIFAGSATIDSANDQSFGFINNDDPPPLVSFTTATQTTDENAGTLTITAQLSEASSQNAIIPLIFSGTATNGADYTVASMAISIPAGSLTGTVTVNLTDDISAEPDETVIVTMGAPLTNASLGAVTTHTVTITANDFVVTNTNDSGEGSLRQAIDNANLLGNGTIPSTITFAIPGAVTHTINLLSPLPNLTKPVVIDGYSQAGASANTLSAGSNAVLQVVVNGSGATGNGLTFDTGSNDSQVKGLVIQGFNNHGIQVDAPNVTIAGNFIGTDASGTTAVANGNHGIFITNSATIGGTSVGDRNLISGNGQSGIYLDDSNASTIEKNLIGVAIDGSTALGNSGDGITINSGTSNHIKENVIANNGLAGVTVPSGTGHKIVGNSIFNNAGLGIDLGSPGIEANDANDADGGANLLQNFPLLTNAILDGSNTFIYGSFNSTPDSSFVVEFFSSPTADPAGHGEGQTFITATLLITDASGNASFPIAIPAVSVGQFLSTTVTDSSGNTSEFSASVAVTPPIMSSITVTPALILATEGGISTYTIALDTLPSNAVQIAIASDAQSQVSLDGTDFAATQVVTLDNPSPRTITIRPIDDRIAEATHSSIITHTIATPALEFPTTLSINSVTAQITDNDIGGISIIPTASRTIVSEDGLNDTYNVVLTSEPTQNVILTINPDKELKTSPTVLTFTPTTWNIPQAITVNANDDKVVEDSFPYHLGIINHSASTSPDPAYKSIPAISTAVSITDNDRNDLSIPVDHTCLPGRKRGGNRKANKLKGTAGADTLRGKGGHDRLKGRDCNDLLMGGKGDDRLVGGNGDDVLVGGVGSDRLKGGGGRDQFIYKKMQEGADQITDFDVSADVLNFSRIIKSLKPQSSQSSQDPLQDYVRLTRLGTKTLVYLDPSRSLKPFNPDTSSPLVILDKVRPSSLNASNFIL